MNSKWILSVNSPPARIPHLLLLLLMATFSLSRSIQSQSGLCFVKPYFLRPHSLTRPKTPLKSRPCPLWSASFSVCLLHARARRSFSEPIRGKQCRVTLRSTPSARYFCVSASSAAANMADVESNPLLKDFYFPPFDSIEAKHVRPGIRALLEKLGNDLEELERTVEPSWPKLVEPLERIVDRLAVVWGAVSHLKSVKDNADLRAAIEEVQPEKVTFELKLGQSKPIYNAFKSIRESSDWDKLSDARKRIVEVLKLYFSFGLMVLLAKLTLAAQIKEAVLNGIALEDDKREEFNNIEQELTKLSRKFEENVLDSTKKFEKLITDKKDIEGLPDTALGLAAQTAVSKGHENATAQTGPWVITLDAPSYMAVMQHAKNRTLREEVYRAYISRASSGDLDNTAIIDQILKLRLEKAKLLGYNNYAEVSMATKMATVEKAEELLEKLRSASWDPAVQDMEELKHFAKNQGAHEADDLNHWDTSFWSERLRESKYEINEEELRPYFSLPKVMDGLFSLANRLFGVNIEAADGLAPVWMSDVHFYRVKDSLGSPIAYFYFDPYSRPSEKRGGAWMDEVVGRSRVLSQDGSSPRLPIAHMVCNQMPPVGDKPSLMTFREVETVFHEFGHALQHMLTKQDEGLVAGIRNVEWDAVELPSQFMENWCYHRDTLMSIGKHYETGESIPEDIYEKLLAARTFRAGSFSLRQLRFATLDLELHTKYVPGGPESIYDVDRRVAERTQLLPPLPDDKFLCSFSHIFAGGYAAGYYSYKWAEVLSADAFSAFEDVGLNDDKAVEETGHRFRETVLALGGGKAPLEVFVQFRGREPSPEALLRHNGLLQFTHTHAQPAAPQRTPPPVASVRPVATIPNHHHRPAVAHVQLAIADPNLSRCDSSSQPPRLPIPATVPPSPIAAVKSAIQTDRDEAASRRTKAMQDGSPPPPPLPAPTSVTLQTSIAVRRTTDWYTHSKYLRRPSRSNYLSPSPTALQPTPAARRATEDLEQYILRRFATI
ncbi:oligopeptidase A [Striga asiatica]|uniref:oligopeptidase A n=1 Tax=Striga asiatica TaxID=4170 RepID=A0A5A7P6Q6_STRAF|nr:oligopeptidase A [Striga asiatica]